VNRDCKPWFLFSVLVIGPPEGSPTTVMTWTEQSCTSSKKGPIAESAPEKT
jgi:hypothetical protein